ncbi:DoxX family protein [Ekhidna sp.]|uniref:DoxX family protein n=1 Tax=Ekhidna sp. TaxID=2608089 RepID=UPI0032EAA8EA
MNERLKQIIGSHPIDIDVSLLILRLSIGGLILLHGIGKLSDLLDGNTSFFDDFDPIGIGGFNMLLLAVISEFCCSILIILGVFMRASLIPLIVTMSIAFFVFHANDQLMDKELPLVYLLSLIALFFSGSGKYSLSKLGKS